MGRMIQTTRHKRWLRFRYDLAGNQGIEVVLHCGSEPSQDQLPLSPHLPGNLSPDTRCWLHKKPADTLDNHPSSPGPFSSVTSSSELISRLPSKRWEIKSQTVPSNIKVSIADKLQQ